MLLGFTFLRNGSSLSTNSVGLTNFKHCRGTCLIIRFFLIVFYKFVMLLSEAVRKSKPETRDDSEGVAVDMTRGRTRAATET